MNKNREEGEVRQIRGVDLPVGLYSKVLIAIGQASTCWTNLEGAGEFVSNDAICVANELLDEIEEALVQMIESERQGAPISSAAAGGWGLGGPITKVQDEPKGEIG